MRRGSWVKGSDVARTDGLRTAVAWLRERSPKRASQRTGAWRVGRSMEDDRVRLKRVQVNGGYCV